MLLIRDRSIVRAFLFWYRCHGPYHVPPLVPIMVKPRPQQRQRNGDGTYPFGPNETRLDRTGPCDLPSRPPGVSVYPRRRPLAVPGSPARLGVGTHAEPTEKHAYQPCHYLFTQYVSHQSHSPPLPRVRVGNDVDVDNDIDNDIAIHVVLHCVLVERVLLWTRPSLGRTGRYHVDLAAPVFVPT